MEIEELKKQTVARLRQVKKERDLTVPMILDLLEEKSYFLSEATVKRVFSENVNPTSFKYRDTISPLADVLLDVYTDKSDSVDVQALKSMLHDKNRTINILLARDEERKLEYEKRIAHLQKQIDTLEKHLEFREKVVERKDDVIEKLINKLLSLNIGDVNTD